MNVPTDADLAYLLACTSERPENFSHAHDQPDRLASRCPMERANPSINRTVTKLRFLPSGYFRR